jgi:hypothetical protein
LQPTGNEVRAARVGKLRRRQGRARTETINAAGGARHKGAGLPMSHDLQVSDDEVLAVICVLGANARVETVRHALAERLSAQVSLASMVGRLQRLCDGGLVRVLAGRVAGDDQVRLTAVGVERLQALQREPLTPPTDF